MTIKAGRPPREVPPPPRAAPGAAAPHSAGRPLDRIDRIDRKIVTELQADATISLALLADRVGLSQTPCWKRVQRLEQTGVLTGRVALADPHKLGLSLTAFVSITAPDHGVAWRDGFRETLKAFPEVVEVWRVAGDADYVLKVVATDMAAYDAFYQRLTASLELRAVSSQFAMERVAYTTALPVPPEPA